MPRPDHAGRPGRGQQLQCLGQAGGSGRVVPGQPPLHHAQALKGSGLTSPQIGERQYISRRTVQTHLVYVFAKLDTASRAQLAAQVTRHRLWEPPRHRSHRPGTALCPVSFRAGRICPALSAPPQQTAERQRFTAQPGPVRRRRDPPDGGCLMLPGAAR